MPKTFKEIFTKEEHIQFLKEKTRPLKFLKRSQNSPLKKENGLSKIDGYGKVSNMGMYSYSKGITRKGSQQAIHDILSSPFSLSAPSIGKGCG
jgi:hypothetical protein